LTRFTRARIALLLILVPRYSWIEQPGKTPGWLPWRETPPRAAYPHGRFAYRYSVIRGGAYSAAELYSAMRTDAVVAAHYAGFDRARVHAVEAAAGRKVFVSYRLDDRVYWTKKAVPLETGEVLLSDGAHEARARCGNRVSDTPQQPTSAQALPEERLNEPEEEKPAADALAAERPPEPKGGTAKETAPAADESSLLVPDIFAPPSPTSQVTTTTPQQQSGFGLPFFSVPATLPPEVIVRGAPPSGGQGPFDQFPVESSTPAPVVVVEISTTPQTWSSSANWIDPGTTPATASLVIAPVASSEPGEVVLSIVTPVPVRPWWWLTPLLPDNPGGTIPLNPGGNSGTPVIPGTPLGPLGPDGKPAGQDTIQAVPEPHPALPVAAALAALAWYARRRSRRSTRTSRP
jgi:hypothetical protein